MPWFPHDMGKRVEYHRTLRNARKWIHWSVFLQCLIMSNRSRRFAKAEDAGEHEGKTIYKKEHWHFKEAYLVFKILFISSTLSHPIQPASLWRSLEQRLVLALGPWHMFFHLLGMHISWSFKWLPPTHYSGCNSNATFSRKPCPTLHKAAPFPQFLSST